MILLGTELRPPGDRGRDQVVGLASDAGFDGLAMGGWYRREEAIHLITLAAASRLAVPVAAAPLLERPLGPGKRLPFLASLEDPEERRAAAELVATTIAAASPLGIGTFTISLGDVGLGVAPERLARSFRRREMDEDEPGGEVLAAALAERRARSPGITDGCRAGLDLVIPAAERAGVTLAIELPAGPWGVPSPREAALLLDEYREAPVGVVWDQARMSVLRRLGVGPNLERAERLRAGTRLWRAGEAVGVEIGYLPGQGETADDAAAIPGTERAVPVVVTGRRDSTLEEVRRALVLTRPTAKAASGSGG